MKSYSYLAIPTLSSHVITAYYQGPSRTHAICFRNQFLKVCFGILIIITEMSFMRLVFFQFQRVGISHGECSFCSNAAIWCSQELPQIVTHNQAVQMIKDNKVFRQGPLIQYKKPTYKKAPTTPYLISIKNVSFLRLSNTVVASTWKLSV